MRKQVQKAQLSQQKYIDSLTVLQEVYQRQQESLDALAERFARVNFDDVEPYYEEALTLFKAGKIDQAIAVLESANPAQRTEQILAEEKRIAQAKAEISAQEVALAKEKKKQIDAVRLLADMYSLSFDPIKAEAQYDQLIQLDSTDLEILQDAADFYRENHRYRKALLLYPKIIKHPEIENWKIANAYGHLGELYTSTGGTLSALSVFKQANLCYDSLIKIGNDNGFYKYNLAISHIKLGETYTLIGQLDSALRYFQDGSQLSKELYNVYSANADFKNCLAASYSKLGSTYSSLEKLDSALYYFRARFRLGKELYDSYEQVFKMLLAMYRSFQK